MWNDEAVLILRYMIDDVDDPVKYSDDRLEQLIFVAAQFVKKENIFEEDYVINVTNKTITPEPTDEAFTNLVVLKASCLLVSAGLMKTAKRGISVSEFQYKFD